MDLRVGYKQTEVGVIPESWITSSIGDTATKVGSGITPTGGDKVYKREGRPFLRSQNVGWGTLLLEDIAYIDEATHETFSSTEIAIDDVFLNITGASIGRSAVADSRVVRGNVNQHVCIIRSDKKQLHPDFLNYFLLSSEGQRQIDSFQTGGNRQGLNFAQIRSFGLPVPSLTEQRAIATALSDVDALLAKIDQLIAKKRDLKQAAMQQLLTGQSRLPGFSGEWEVKRLGDVVEIRKGQLITEKTVVFGEIPVIAGGKKPAYFHNEPNRTGKTITVSASGASAGYVALFDRPIFASDCSTISEGSDYSIEFVFFQMQFHQDAIYRAQTGGAQPHIHAVDLAPIEIGCPEPEEQTAIATVLSDMDAELAALEARRDKTRALKQGMMQALLTGRIRLVEPN